MRYKILLLLIAVALGFGILGSASTALAACYPGGCARVFGGEICWAGWCEEDPDPCGNGACTCSGNACDAYGDNDNVTPVEPEPAPAPVPAPAPAPTCASNAGQECFSGTNSCGQYNVGSYDCWGNCSATTPSNSQCGSCVPGNECLYGGVYYGGQNYCCAGNPDYVCNRIWTCGSNWQCNTPGREQIHYPQEPTCGCSNGSYIKPPGNYGNTCKSAKNDCDQQNTGTIQCDGKTCSASVPPNPAGYGRSCVSAPNACGQTNSGTIQCNGRCSAVPPSSASCPPPAPQLPSPPPKTCEELGTCPQPPPPTCEELGTCPQPPPPEPPPNSSPSASPSAPTTGDYCGASSPPVFLSWQFSDPDGDSQRYYRVQVDNNPGFSSPEADSGQVSSSSTQYSPPGLPYNTTFNWRVRVWDNQGANSSWSSGSGFTTAAHQYPTSNFSWSPANPGELQTTRFTDTSQVYGGASKSAWSWTFQQGSPATSTQQNPSAQFTPIGIKQVTLRLTDSSGYSCQISRSVNVQLPFPDWQEISPFGARNFLRAFARMFSFASLF